MDRESRAASIPHRTSIAVWDVPSPVVKETAFTVTVGAKCAAGCQLVGQPGIVRNQKGSAVGQGAIEEGPWPGTTALYATQVQLTAPTSEGVHLWTVETTIAFHSDQLHQCASATLSFRIAKPPEHQVTVTVSERDSGAPLEKAEASLGLYRTMTDDQGRARLAVPSGNYALQVWKRGYVAPPQTLIVNDNVTAQTDATPVSVEDPDAQQVWM